MATEQVPSIGRVVHFVYGDKHYAAIITDPADSYGLGAPTTQALTVFPPNQSPFTTVAVFDAECGPSTWHWPEYVPAKG